MRTLKREFDIAKKMSSPSHAKEVLQVAKHIHDNLTSMESTWPRRVLVKNFRKLINWMERGQRHVRNLDPENSNELVE